MEYNKQEIGRKVKQAREFKHYTQEYLAEKVNLEQETISRIECGRGGISIETMIAFCDVLEFSPNYLLGYDSSNDTPFEAILSRLTKEQVEDLQEIIKIFIKNCK
jgi:transcriptional regulator with XRE-family HTH domain